MKKCFYAVLVALLLIGGIVTFKTFAARSGESYSVEMSVNRLSCGSCVETIREAVSALDGAVKVETDVAAARSSVVFDPELIDADLIAQTITNSGYPASILYVKNSQGEKLSGIDTEKYVARIGSRMVLRDAFNQALEARLQKAELSTGSISIRTACQDAWFSLLQQELLLNAAGQFGVTVSDADLEKQFNEISAATATDRQALHKSMMIDGYLALHYPEKKPNGIEMSNLLNALNANTAVDIFDRDLKRYLSAGSGSSGCGGSCCG